MKQPTRYFPRTLENSLLRNTVALLLAVGVGGSLCGQVSAQTNEPPTATQDQQDRLNSLEQRLNGIATDDLDPISLILPSIGSNVPTAYGASKGMTALGVGFQERTRFGNKSDGTVAALVGLSNARRVGVDVQVSLLDLSEGDRFALGFKLHRQFANDTTVALGAENALASSSSDSRRSFYAVVSKKLRLSPSSRKPFSRLYLSLGVGTGRFLSENDVRNNTGNVNVFGNVATNINRDTTIFAEWTGQTLGVGTSIVPFRKHPFVVTLALADITNGAGDGTRFTAGLGYVFTR